MKSANLLLSGLLAFAVWACDLSSDPSEGSPYDPCSTSTGDDVQAGGTWTLTGNGTRSGCEDDKYDADNFRLTAQPLKVTQNDTSLQLDTSGSPKLASFQLQNAYVNGKCVKFTTLESGSQGTIKYVFDGTMSSSGSNAVYGTFTGTGPTGCSAEGSFTLQIE